MFFSLKPCFAVHFLCPSYLKSLIQQLFEGLIISHSAGLAMPEKKSVVAGTIVSVVVEYLIVGLVFYIELDI